MKNQLILLCMTIVSFQCLALLQHGPQECAASLLGLIEKNDMPQVQLKLKECSAHTCVDDQFKSVRELVKDKPEMVDKISKIQCQVNDQQQNNNPQVESPSRLTWWMKFYGCVLAFAAAAGIITKYQELNEELKDIERRERWAKLRQNKGI